MMTLIRRFVQWMETGDLIPALLAVSVPHYAHVLQQYDFAVVAAALGFLVDVGHYRTIKLYLRGRGWFWMVVLTMFSAGFHIAFYALGGAGGFAIALGLAPTMVIFALAYITKNERLDKKGDTGATGKTSTPTAATSDATAPRQVEPVSREKFMTIWQSNGHKSITALANELHVNPRTAQRWVAYGTAATDEDKPTVA